MMFNFLKNHPSDFSHLQVDLHSHLIPSIDDGVKSLEQSLFCIQQLSELGFKKIITTPHIMGDYYPNTSEIIQTGQKNVNQALNEQQINIQIAAAAEYYVDDFFVSLLRAKEPLQLMNGNRILIEFPLLAPPIDPFQIIFELKTMKLQPILAHPERYVYYANQLEIFERLKAQGCEFQLNLLSLLGHYGKKVQKLGLTLLKNKWIDFAGTDLHHEHHLQILKAGLQKKRFPTLFWQYEFKNKII
ncbi:MAG: tyrosine-protein phosphatase [Saprospiraceae bacterium]